MHGVHMFSTKEITYVLHSSLQATHMVWCLPIIHTPQTAYTFALLLMLTCISQSSSSSTHLLPSRLSEQPGALLSISISSILFEGAFLSWQQHYYNGGSLLCRILDTIATVEVPELLDSASLISDGQASTPQCIQIQNSTILLLKSMPNTA